MISTSYQKQKNWHLSGVRSLKTRFYSSIHALSKLGWRFVDGDGYRSKEPINVSYLSFPILSAQRFPVWKRRTPFLYICRLFGSPVRLDRWCGASLLTIFAPNGLQQAPWGVFDRLLANNLELDYPSSFIPFFEMSNQHRETRMSDLSLQPRKHKQAEALSFFVPSWPSLNIFHLSGIRSIVIWLDLSKVVNSVDGEIISIDIVFLHCWEAIIP
jgi:hypothetical protein